MEPLTALIIANLPGLTDNALSALPDAPVVVVERPRRFRLRRLTAPSVTVAPAPAPVTAPGPC